MRMFELLPRPLGSIFRKLTHLACNSRVHTHLSGVWYLSKKEVAEMKKGAALAVPSPCAPLPSRPQVSAVRAVRVVWRGKGKGRRRPTLARASPALPSAMGPLTSVFGMGTGMTAPLWPPARKPEVLELGRTTTRRDRGGPFE